MAKKNCIKCTKTEGMLDKNYAGTLLTISPTHFPFPKRIKPLTLPGNKSNNFLCNECANKIYVRCSVHGALVKETFSAFGQPRCKACDIQMEAIYNDEFPAKFDWIFPLTEIHVHERSVSEGWLAASDDGQLHIISKKDKCVLTDGIDNFEFSITTKDDFPTFCIKHKLGSAFSIVKNDKPLNNAKGQWIKCWNNGALNDVFKSTEPITELYLLKIEENSIPNISQQSPAKYLIAHKPLLATIHNHRLITFPSLSLPNMENISSWRTEFETIRLLFEVDSYPIIFSFNSINNIYDTNFLARFSSILPSDKKNQGGTLYDIAGKKKTEVMTYSGERHKAILHSLKHGIKITLLPSKEELTAAHGYTYHDKCIAITDQYDAFCFTTGNSANTAQIKNHLTVPKSMFRIKTEKAELYVFFLLDKQQEKAHKITINEKELTIDNKKFDYSDDFELKSQKIDDNRCNFFIEWNINNEKESVQCVVPTEISFAILETWETSSAATKSQQLTLPDLYKEYNFCKRNNLLYVLFADIFILNREVNKKESLSELANKLLKISSTEFYEDKDLLNRASEKIIILNEGISQLKKKLEILGSFYPYYALESETNWLSDAFGSKVAQSVLQVEKNTIISQYRGRVRLVQAEARRTLSEIERAIAPARQFFNKKEIRSTTFSKISSRLPTAAQAVIGVGVIASGGASAMLGAMIGINVLGQALNYFQDSKESAASVKNAIEEAASWWQLFMTSSVVTVYETSQFIEEENNRCMIRDKKLLDQVPSNLRSQYLENIPKSLQKKIVREKYNGRLEILDGSGVTIESLVTDITSTIENDMACNVKGFIDSLTISEKRI